MPDFPGDCPLCTEEDDLRKDRLRQARQAYLSGTPLDRIQTATGLPIADLLTTKDRAAWDLVKTALKSGQDDKAINLVKDGASLEEKYNHLFLMLEELVRHKLQGGLDSPTSIKLAELKYGVDILRSLYVARSLVSKNPNVGQDPLQAFAGLSPTEFGKDALE